MKDIEKLLEDPFVKAYDKFIQWGKGRRQFREVIEKHILKVDRECIRCWVSEKDIRRPWYYIWCSSRWKYYWRHIFKNDVCYKEEFEIYCPLCKTYNDICRCAE